MTPVISLIDSAGMNEASMVSRYVMGKSYQESKELPRLLTAIRADLTNPLEMAFP